MNEGGKYLRNIKNIKYKHMRNQELIDKRFDQIDGKIKTLNYLLSRQSSVNDFKNELNQLEEIVGDLKSLVERDLSPLRNG
jgi:archaellum component FlaC